MVDDTPEKENDRWDEHKRWAQSLGTDHHVSSGDSEVLELGIESHQRTRMHNSRSHEVNDDSQDQDDQAYIAADAMLLDQTQRHSDWQTHSERGHGISWASIRRLRHGIGPTNIFALLRTMFNYPEPRMKLSSTAWLDGLRGLAAFEVFLFHYNDGWIDRRRAWGVGDARMNPAWYYLPLIRTFFASGDAAVCLFFAISGYALSHKLLLLMRRPGSEAEILTSLSSAIIRRAIRLYTPVLIETFILMMACRIFNMPKPMVYEAAPTFLLELWTWLQSFVYLLLPVQSGLHWERMYDRYDGGISWTIPMEYHGSLQIYLAILFLCRIKTIKLRRLLTLLWIAKSFWRDDWAAAQFLSGMTFADYQIEREHALSTDTQQSLPSTGRRPRGIQRFIPSRTFCFAALFVFGFYLSGLPGAFWDGNYPDQGRLQPRPLFDWIVQPLAMAGLWVERDGDRYLMCFASICCLVAIGEIRLLQKLPEMRFVQYIGKLSFGLYLCHVFIRAWLAPMKTVCLGAVGVDASQTDSASKILMFGAYLLMMIPAITINLFVAGLFERFLDKPSVRAGRRFENWCLGKIPTGATPI